VADDADRAGDVIDRQMAEALAKVRRPPQGLGPKRCECGELMPTLRRAGGYPLCVECQADREGRR